MGLLTTINEVPLYDTIQEALLWAKQYNLQSYHVHYFNGIKGYMGGDNHQQITQALQLGIQTALSPIEFSLGDFAVTDNEIQFYSSISFPSLPVNEVETQQNINQPVIPQVPQEQVAEQIIPPIPQPQPQNPQPPTSPPSGGGGSGY
jgi:hypothetical protein